MKLLSKLVCILAILLFLPAFGSGERLFAPGSDLWERWQKHDAGSTATIDHSAWTKLLKKHLKPSNSGVARVGYAAFAGNSADRKALKTYLESLASTPVSSFNRKEQMAYWINLYNALTIEVVLDHYPVKSIRDIDISPGLFGSGPWGKKLVTVEGEGLTLNDIEHRILRPVWQDPRLHYAVNCASIGCPNLQPVAWSGAKLGTMLDQAARQYVNDPRGVTIDGDKVVVSRIFDWFLEDFRGSEESVISHLKQYAEPGLKAELERIGDLHSTAYDWPLNDD